MNDLYKSISDDVPALSRGRVWCHDCHTTQLVNPSRCLHYGWPKCPGCGYTMTIDSPHETLARKAPRGEDGRFKKVGR